MMHRDCTKAFFTLKMTVSRYIPKHNFI